VIGGENRRVIDEVGLGSPGKESAAVPWQDFRSFLAQINT